MNFARTAVYRVIVVVVIVAGRVVIVVVVIIDAGRAFVVVIVVIIQVFVVEDLGILLFRHLLVLPGGTGSETF